MFLTNFPFYKQQDAKDCGPTCLRMICKYYGRVFNAEFLQRKCGTNRLGVSFRNLSMAAESIGFRSIPAKMNFQSIKEQDMPVIIHWKGNHFVVAYKLTEKYAWVADPAHGRIRYSRKDFITHW